MFDKKQKILLLGLAGLAFISLIFGFILFRVTPDKEPEIHPDILSVDLHTYEEYVHQCGRDGKFETNAELFGQQLSNLSTNINIVECVDNNIKLLNGLTIVIVDETTVEIVAPEPLTDKLIVQINKIDKVISITTLPNNCEHRFVFIQNDAGDCEKNSLEFSKCELCQQSRTRIELATGHDFSQGCSTISQCSICGSFNENAAHVFDAERVEGKFLMKVGTCITKAQYYYSCIYCDEFTTTKVFNHDYEPLNHRKAKQPTINKINNDTVYYTLKCQDCASDLVYAYVRTSKDATGNTLVSIESDGQVLFSLDDKNYSDKYPVFNTTATYTLYYQIVKKDYVIKDSMRINWKNVEYINIEQFANTSKENPYLITGTTTLNGTVFDVNGIFSFMIDNEPVNVDEQGRWQYEFTPAVGERITLTFLLTDTYYQQTSVTHYLYCYGNESEVKFAPVVHTSSNIVEINGQIQNVDNLISLLVDGKDVVVKENGLWNKRLTIEQNTEKEISVVATYRDGTIIKEIHTICYISNLPTIDLTSFANNVLYGSITDNNLLDCSYIETICIYGFKSIDGFTLNDAITTSTVTDGLLIYNRPNSGKKMLEFTIDLEQYRNAEMLAIEATTSHGHQVMYRFHLSWKYNQLVGISVDAINMITNTTQTFKVDLDELQRPN